MFLIAVYVDHMTLFSSKGQQKNGKCQVLCISISAVIPTETAGNSLRASLRAPGDDLRDIMEEKLIEKSALFLLYNPSCSRNPTEKLLP